MTKDYLISLVIAFALIIISNVIPVYSQEDDVPDVGSDDTDIYHPNVELPYHIGSNQLESPTEYVRYQSSDYVGHSIESFSYVIWNNGDAYITSLKYKIIIKDPKGKTLFTSKPYQYNKPILPSVPYNEELGQFKTTPYNKVGPFTIYLDKPIKSKWSISPQNHPLKLEVISFTIDKKKTAENLCYLSSARGSEEERMLWQKIVDLSPTFLTDKHSVGITTRIKVFLGIIK